VGGAEKMLLNLVRRLPKEKYEMTVCCLSDADHFGKEFERKSVKLEVLDMKSVFDLINLIRLLVLMKKGRFHIIHTIMYHSNILGRILGKLFKIPVIISGERNTGNRRTYFHSLLNRITAPWCDMILCVSESASKFLIEEEKITNVPIRVIRNGIGKAKVSGECRELVRKTNKLPRDAPMLVTVCRIDRQKGLDCLIKSLKITLERFPDVFWVLVGDVEHGNHRRQNKYKNRLKSLIKELDIGRSVYMLGLREDVYEILAASDIFVLSSLFEGIPNSLLEAMTIGLPCVATEVGGIPEIMQSGQNGLLVPPSDHNSLADAVCSLITEPERSLRLGREAKRRVQRQMDWDVMTRETEAVYSELLRKKFMVV
jgi:glycosyltransferase involved in cell wall biosynthesis